MAINLKNLITGTGLNLVTNNILKNSSTNVKNVSTPANQYMSVNPKYANNNTVKTPVNTPVSTPVQTQQNQYMSVNPKYANTQTTTPVQTPVSTPVNNQSRFIGFQNNFGVQNQFTQQTQNMMNGGALNVLQQQKEEKAKKTNLNIPTIKSTNTQNANTYIQQMKVMKDFQADVYKNNGQMTEDQIARLYPEFSNNIPKAMELQKALYPIVRNGEYVDETQIRKYFPEFIQDPKLKSDKEITKEAKSIDDENKKIFNKAKNVNQDLLSYNGKVFANFMIELSKLPSQVRSQYNINKDATDSDIITFLYNNDENFKKEFDRVQNLELTNLDKTRLGVGGWWLNKFSVGVSDALNTANQWYQKNIAQPTAGTPVLGAITQTAGTAVAGADKTLTNLGQLTNGEYDSLSGIAGSGIKSLGGAMESTFGTAYLPATLGFNLVGQSEVGQEVLENTVGLVPRAITTAFENTPVLKDFYNSLDEEARADLSNELTIALLHGAGKYSQAKGWDIKAGVASDAIINALQRGKYASKFQIFVEKGLADEKTGKFSKGALNRIIKEGGREFESALKDNFSRFNEVVEARKQARNYTPTEPVPEDNTNLVDKRTPADKVKSAVKNTAEDITNKAKDIFKKEDKAEVVETKNEVTAKEPEVDENGWMKPQETTMNKVTSGIGKTIDKAVETVKKPVNKVAEVVADTFTANTTPQDKLFKAVNPSHNILSNKKGNFQKKRANSDRTNQLIIEYGHQPTNSAEYYANLIATKQELWRDNIAKGLDEHKFTEVDTKGIVASVLDELGVKPDHLLESNRGSYDKLQAELQSLLDKQKITLEHIESIKQQLNAKLNYGKPVEEGQIYEEGMRILNRKLSEIEDTMISEIPGEFNKFKRDYGALKDMEQDVLKMWLRDMKKKNGGGGLIKNVGRIEAIGNAIEKPLTATLQWIMGEATDMARDNDYLISKGFEQLAQQFKGEKKTLNIKQKPGEEGGEITAEEPKAPTPSTPKNEITSKTPKKETKKSEKKSEKKPVEQKKEELKNEITKKEEPKALEVKKEEPKNELTAKKESVETTKKDDTATTDDKTLGIKRQAKGNKFTNAIVDLIEERGEAIGDNKIALKDKNGITHYTIEKNGNEIEIYNGEEKDIGEFTSDVNTFILNENGSLTPKTEDDAYWVKSIVDGYWIKQWILDGDNGGRKVSVEEAEKQKKAEAKKESEKPATKSAQIGLKPQKNNSRINVLSNVISKIIDKYEDKISNIQGGVWVGVIKNEPYEPLEISYFKDSNNLIVRQVTPQNFGDPAMKFQITKDGGLHAVGVKQAFMESQGFRDRAPIKDSDGLMKTWAVNLEDQFLGERTIDEDTGNVREETKSDLTSSKNELTSKKSEAPLPEVKAINNLDDFKKEIIDKRDTDGKIGLLYRMKSDVDYIVNNNLGERGYRHLRATENPKKHIEYMKALYDSIPENERPNIDINEYAKKLGVNIEDTKKSKKSEDLNDFDVDKVKKGLESGGLDSRLEGLIASTRKEQPKSKVDELVEKNGKLEFDGDTYTYRYSGDSYYTQQGTPVMEGENVKILPKSMGNEILEKQLDKAFDNGLVIKMYSGEEINGQIFDHIEVFEGDKDTGPGIEFYRTSKHGDTTDYSGMISVKHFLNEYGKEIQELQTTKKTTAKEQPKTEITSKKNAVTTKPATDEDITGRFRNLTAEDYREMKQFENKEELYYNSDNNPDALAYAFALEDVVKTLENDDIHYDEYDNFDFDLNDPKAIVDRNRFIKEFEFLQRAESGKATKEDMHDHDYAVDNWEDFDEKHPNKFEPDWNIEMIRESVIEFMQGAFGKGTVYDPFATQAFYTFEKLIENKDKYLKDIDTKRATIKKLVDKYGKWWEPAKKDLKSSENTNIISNKNDLTSKPNNNGNTNLGTSTQTIGGSNQGVGGGNLRNEVSNLQSNEGNKTGIQRTGSSNVSTEMNTSGKSTNLSGDGSSTGLESSGVKTVGQQRKINEESRDILEKHNFSTSRSDYTQDELNTLFQYEGNGGLAKAGDENIKGTRYEYYTPKNAVDALQRGLEKYTDKAIESVEDPTAGKGNMLAGFGDNVKKVMYEISPISGTIAKLRFPDAKVGIGEKDGDFQRRYLNYQGQKAYDFPRDGSNNVDALLINPPFGKRITIKDEPKIKALEDYFVKRSIEHDLKFNGVAGLLMPSRWLKAEDSITKQWLANNTEFVDAYRLPAGVFSYTDVGTDLIILKKKSGVDNASRFFDDNYFKENPDKVLGVEKERSTRHGMETYIDGDPNVINTLWTDNTAPVKMNSLTETPKTEITAKTQAPVENMPKNLITNPEQAKIEPKTEEKSENMEFKPDKQAQKKAEAKKDTEKKPAKRGKNEKITTSKGTKTDIGTYEANGNMVSYKYQAMTDADGYINDLSIDQIQNSPILNYIDGKAQIDDLYFAGNIYEKLQQLELDKDKISEAQYKKQKDGLQAVLPPKLTVDEITWSPTDKDILKLETSQLRTYYDYSIREDVTEKKTVQQVFEDWMWKKGNDEFVGTDTDKRKIMNYVKGKKWQGERLSQRYNESDAEFELRKKNKRAEEEQSKQATRERAKTFFNDFVKLELDKDIQDKITEEYNTRLRAVVKPDYKHMPLQIKDMSATFHGKPLVIDPVQIEGINAMLSKGSMLIAHGVGYGKTLEGVIATVGSMQRGWTKRPLLIVPKGTRQDWINTIHDLFPNQEVIDLGGLDAGDMKRLRKDLGDDPSKWIKDGQIAIITHPGFDGKINFKSKTQEELQEDLRDVMGSEENTARQDDTLQENIENIAETINKKKDTKKLRGIKGELSTKYGDEILEQLDSDLENMSKAEFVENFVSKVSELERFKETPEEVLKADAEAMYETKPIFLEDLGIDHITIDEVHNYKNIFTSAKLKKDKKGNAGETNPYGSISGSSSSRGRKMFATSQYILKNNNGRGVFSLSATPFNNQPIEVYNMLSLHAYNRLVEKGIQNINSFFDHFADFRTEFIANALKKGGGEYGQVMKDFNNLPEMQRLIGEYIDYVGDNPNLVRPEKRMKKVVLTPSDKQREVQEYLQQKEALIAGSKGSGGQKESVLPLYTDMRLNIISPYLTSYGKLNYDVPTAKEFIESSPKLKFAVDTIKALRDEGRNDGVFIYMPYGIEYHSLLQQAIEEAVGKDRVKVGIINGSTTGTETVDGEKVEKRIAIADKFRKGELNVLIGGRNTVEGINLQDNGFITINTLIGWNPTEITQLNGRIHRQGNLRDHVIELLPLLTDGGDVMMMQKYDEKANRINNIFESQGRTFNLEELDPEEEKMALNTDPKRKAELSIDIDKKKLDKDIQKYTAQNGTLNDIINRMPEETDIQYYKDEVEKLQKESKEIKEAMKALNPESSAYSSLSWDFDSKQRQLKNAKERLKDKERDLQWATAKMNSYAIDNIEGVKARIDENKQKISDLVDTKDKLDAELPQRIAKFQKEYEEWKKNMKTPEEYLEDLKEDFRSLKVFGERQELKDFLDTKKAQNKPKNEITANSKNELTSKSSLKASKGEQMSVDVSDLMEKNTKPQLEQGEVKGEMYHVTPEDFEQFKEDNTYNDIDWNTTFGTFVTDSKAFLEDFKKTAEERRSINNEWKTKVLDVDAKKVILHPADLGRAFGYGKESESILIDYLEKVGRWNIEEQKNIIGLKMLDTGEWYDIDYDTYPRKDSYTKEEILEMPGNVYLGILQDKFEGGEAGDLMWESNAEEDAKKLRELGYDAVKFYEGDINGEPVYSLALFHPNKYLRNGITSNGKNDITSKKSLKERMPRNQISVGVDDLLKKNEITNNSKNGITNNSTKKVKKKPLTEEAKKRVRQYKSAKRNIRKLEKKGKYDEMYGAIKWFNWLGHWLSDFTGDPKWKKQAYTEKDNFAIKEIKRRGPSIIRRDNRTVDNKGNKKKPGYSLTDPRGKPAFHVKYKVGRFAKKEKKRLRKQNKI